MFFVFGKRVPNPNADMERLLKAELPLIILKCAKAYLQESRKSGQRGIWSTQGERVLPEYFDDQRNSIMTNNNPLMHFLYTQKLSFNSEYYMPYEDFWAAFKTHCTQNNFTLPKKGGFTEDYYFVAFERRGLSVVDRVRKVYPRNGTATKHVKYLMGCDLCESTDGAEGGGAEGMQIG